MGAFDILINCTGWGCGGVWFEMESGLCGVVAIGDQCGWWWELLKVGNHVLFGVEAEVVGDKGNGVMTEG